MGNIYRFVEPVVLLMLQDKGRSYGYDLAANLRDYALTDAQIERAALYRTLRRLEENGYVVSTWNTRNGGPARRVYALTQAGGRHLRDWAQVLDNLGTAMSRFSRRAGSKRSSRQARRSR
jgi:PadR family transcriptional regulator PadR